jgi:hypothetical protein
LAVIETLPVTVPVLVGAKVTVNVVLDRAERVLGTESPLMRNPVPVTVACVILIVAVPVFESVTV